PPEIRSRAGLPAPSGSRAEVGRPPADITAVRRSKAVASILAAAAASLGLFAASASATFEATMATRQASARAAGPTFTVEAGGGRRTRILDLSGEAGACGSSYAPLLDASRAK